MTQIIERTGFTDKAEAEALAEEFRFDGWTAEVIEEDDGTWTLRATPPVRAAASNQNRDAVGGTDGAETIAAGAPESANTSPLSGLLDFIATYESNGNYNAYYRHAGNQTNPKFTQMKLDSVLEWQRRYVANGSASSAAGRYQIILKTLRGLIASMGLDGATARFTQEMQDKMAIKLLEVRGLTRYLAGTMSAEDFANEVTKEWASMPIVTNGFADRQGRTNRRGFSYYAGDGLNKAHADPDAYLRAVRDAK